MAFEVKTLKQIRLIIIALLFAACGAPEDKVTLVAMDLIPCLGQIDTPEPRPNEAIQPVDSTCRETLDSKID